MCWLKIYSEWYKASNFKQVSNFIIYQYFLQCNYELKKFEYFKLALEILLNAIREMDLVYMWSMCYFRNALSVLSEIKLFIMIKVCWYYVG